MMLEKPRQLMYQWNTRRNNNHWLEKLEAHLKTSDPILVVHQMGRAGSMTTVNSLRSAGFALPVYHTHWLNVETIQKRLNNLKQRPESSHPLNIRVAHRLAEELKRDGTTRRRWKLVSIFREPVARNISVFFLSIDAFVDDFFRRYACGEVDNDQLLEVFLRDFPHDQPIDWFEKEVRQVFGIDVYEYPFPQDLGYQVIRTERVDLLLIKLERLNNCYQDAFRDFLGINVPRLEHTHITEQNPSYSMYKDFVRHAMLPSSYLERIYQSRFGQHFYGLEERQAFERKWSTAEA